MVFVTGATGLLGSHLIYFLARSGYSVCGLFRSGGNPGAWRFMLRNATDEEGLDRRISMEEGNVLDMDSLRTLVKNAECVYHCAAIVSFNGSDSRNLLNVNSQGTENIASLCLEYGVRLCYVSSIAALGDPEYDGQLIDERTPEIHGTKHSVYSRSKKEAEKIVWNYIGKGLDAVIVNPSIILGGGMWDRSSARLFITAARGIPFYTSGGNGYVDVRDVCELMIRLGQDRGIRGERFILNGGNYAYRELFSEVAGALGRRPPWLKLSSRFTEVIWRLLAVREKITGEKPAFTRETARSSQHRSYYSNVKILKQFPDFRFRTLRDTVAHIADAYRADFLTGL